VDFVRLFRYDDWANREELRALRESANAQALRLFAHIIGTEWVWYARLRGEPPREAVWPDISLDGCEQSLDLIGSFWMEFISGADLDATVSYTNSKGEPWTSRIEDILMHVVMHGAYHRGQIATVLRVGGEQPVTTDYIHCVRSEFI
jgi:uncharacterized damage-inducible protein DinB